MGDNICNLAESREKQLPTPSVASTLLLFSISSPLVGLADGSPHKSIDRRYSRCSGVVTSSVTTG